MSKMILSYFAILLTFLSIDMVWLLGIARSTYVAELGGLMRKQPNFGAAAIFYFVYAAGIAFFAIRPALDAASWPMAVGLGALLGLVAYGTYDLTNLSVMEGFGPRIAFIDMAWGIFVTAASAGLVTALLKFWS